VASAAEAGTRTVGAPHEVDLVDGHAPNSTLASNMQETSPSERSQVNTEAAR
jgi:hypothetical protein